MSEKEKVLKAKLAKHIESSFYNLDSQWNQDSLFCELFEDVGKIAVKYADERCKLIESKPQIVTNSIDDLIISIIKGITKTRIDSKIEPVTAPRQSIEREVFYIIQKTLKSLENKGVIKCIDTINYENYKVI